MKQSLLKRSGTLLGCCLAGAVGAGLSHAFDAHGQNAEQDRLVVHRLEVVDAKGTPRLILAAPTPDPKVDGVAKRRVYPVSGLVLLDAQGNERGGMGIADVPGGAPVLALDHDNFDATGLKVLPDGSVSFVINERRPGPVKRGNMPAQRIRLEVAADGSPALVMADAQDRPRIRLALSGDGDGELQFLSADGKVVRTLSSTSGER